MTGPIKSEWLKINITADWKRPHNVSEDLVALCLCWCDEHVKFGQREGLPCVPAWCLYVQSRSNVLFTVNESVA